MGSGSRLTSFVSRLTIALASLLLGVGLISPLWHIGLVAPQYPEGIGMYIWASKITGEKPHDLASLNGLNHYIGMHSLDGEHFAELRILPYSFVLGGLLCLLAALLRRRLITTLVLVGGIISGLGSMGIMFYELYSYGHNLDPKAAIDVPPFMPAPIGVNQLANFRVTTFFHLGSVLFLAAIVALMLALWISRPQVAGRKTQTTGAQIHAAQ